MTVRSDYGKTLDFLRKWAPGGPWDLVAIPIERGQGRLEGGRFGPDTETEALQWLEENGKAYNLYFHVNVTEAHGGAKAKEEHITAVRALQVDIDPRDPESCETQEEREEWLSAERKRIFDGSPVKLPHLPSTTIDSGGGFQYYMRFETPIPIDGPEDIERFKLYNKKLADLAGGDKAHSIDHIMRLPGTLNRPDSGKRKKGRKLALAQVVEFTDRTYALEDFEPAAPAAGKKGAGKGAKFVDDDELAQVGGRRTTSGNVIFDLPESPPRFESPQDFPESIPDLAKVVIIQGKDPEDPDRWPSRSEALFYVCCALWRAGLTAPQIYGIITDNSWAISESVHDARDKESYAHKQLVSSYEQTRDSDLAELNERFTVISSFGGKCLIVEDVYDPAIKRFRLTKQNFTNFQQRFCHQRIQIGTSKKGVPEYMPRGKWWILHPHRKQCESIAFLPGQDVDGIYNLWRGFAFEPSSKGSCERYLAHVRDNICRGIEERYEYLLNWMAYAIQFPDRQGEIAVVLRGGQGTGKGIFANTFGKLWGRHYMPISSAKHLTGAFNQHLRDCVVLFADEAFYAGDKQHEGTLKALVTEPLLTIEAKGVDAETSSNYLHVIMASNEEWVIPANVQDRRFFVLDVGEAHQQDEEYFGKLLDELEAGGYAALLHLLQTRDVSQFRIRKYPETEVLRDQKERSLAQHEAWWKDKLNGGEILPGEGWPEMVGKSFLDRDYKLEGRGKRSPAYLKIALANLRPGEHQVFKSRAPGPVVDMHGAIVQVERPLYYRLPSLEECRAHFDKNFGGPYAWDDVEEAPEEETDAPIEETTDVY
jgi:hypothetical protein